MMRIFPAWMAELGCPEVVLQGVDLPINAPPEAYRRVVARIKADPEALGALITTHKIDLFAAARDLFDDLGHYARICAEVSCISRRDGRLEGEALDPVSAGQALSTMLGDAYFAREPGAGDVVCFGAGGAATAIALHLASRPSADDRPRRFVVVDRAPDRLAKLRDMIKSLQTDIHFVYVENEDPRRNDRLMQDVGAGALVINATGMGKDRPGSPITGVGQFPPRALAWELNYRGEREFLRQARAQQQALGLRVEDGWDYFMHGWIDAIGRVLHRHISREEFERLAAIAREITG
jgi:shikimate 5-dehydrogenase